MNAARVADILAAQHDILSTRQGWEKEGDEKWHAYQKLLIEIYPRKIILSNTTQEQHIVFDD